VSFCSAQSPVLDKSVSFLENVFGWNMAEYNVTLTLDTPVSLGEGYYFGPTSQSLMYTVKSTSESSICDVKLCKRLSDYNRVR
jgi:hypothetical protein